MGKTVVNIQTKVVDVVDLTEEQQAQRDAEEAAYLAAAPQRMCDDIDKKCLSVCAAGISWNGSTFGYQSNEDRDLKLALLGQLNDGEVNPHNGYIKDSSGVKVTMGDAEALAMLKALRAYVPKVVQASHTAKDTLPVDLTGYDVTTSISWPSNVYTYP